MGQSKDQVENLKHFRIENTTYPNPWDVVKAVQRGEFIAIKCLCQKILGDLIIVI